MDTFSCEVGDYLQAMEADPKGKTCGRCGGENHHCDDVGWFYWKGPQGFVAVCEPCWIELDLHTAER